MCKAYAACQTECLPQEKSLVQWFQLYAELALTCGS